MKAINEFIQKNHVTKASLNMVVDLMRKAFDDIMELFDELLPEGESIMFDHDETVVNVEDYENYGSLYGVRKEKGTIEFNVKWGAFAEAEWEDFSYGDFHLDDLSFILELAIGLTKK